MGDYQRLRPAEAVLPMVQRQPGKVKCPVCKGMVDVRIDPQSGEIGLQGFCRREDCPVA